MADIVIRGMEMPKTCQICRTAKFDRIVGCEEWDRLSIAQRMHKRSETCPLAPLPEGHGRLVDADALESIIGGFSLNWEYGQGVSDCWDALISAPTILEAEEGRADNDS